MAEENPYKSPVAEALSETLESNGEDAATAVPVSTGFYGIGLVIGLLAAAVFTTFFVVLGSTMASSQLLSIFIVGCLAFFSLWFTVCGLYYFRPDRFALMIDQRGIHERYTFGRTTLEWSNISSIELGNADGGSIVAFNLIRRSRWNWHLGEHDYYLVNRYAMSNRELVWLLRDRRIRFAGD